MVKRNYTEEAYEQIIQTIEQIDNTDVNPVVDFFGDLFQRLAQYLEIYSVEQYQDDMQKWYNKVLDSHNTTIKKVDSIFKAVEDVDFEYRGVMDGACKSIVSFCGVLNTLRDVISGKATLEDGKVAAAGYLADGKSKLNTAYDTILTKMEQRTLWDASKALFGDALKWGAGFCAILTATDPVKFTVACKKFLDTFVATVYDLRTMGAIFLPPFTAWVDSWDGDMSISYEEYLDKRYSQLTQAQEYKDTNSISDWLGGISEDLTEDLAECPEDSPYYSVVEAAAKGSQFISKGSQVVDIVVDAYDILSGLKGTHDMLYGNEYTVGEFADTFENKKGYPQIMEITDGQNGPIIKAKDSPADFLIKLVSDRTGIPLSGWKDPEKSPGNTYKTLGTLWSWAEKLLPNPEDGQSNNDDLWNVGFDKFKDSKFIKDVFDFARELDDFATPENNAVLASGG